ncbi:MAG: ATP-dependent DNA helicase PcrA [Lachnospiraceae bacterium]|nr:ATP-dependent DNA helicase PcrA [Lachnospiraceae bacterium]
MEILNGLNKEQLAAVTHNDGPLLILAGAGSGKTRVLTYRIAYLISQHNVSPWNIIALTFTNKAADEMRERINNIVGDDAQNIWVSTFHSTCVRILRRFGDSLGYERSFTIYDTDDSKSAIKAILKRRNIDPKVINEKKALSVISSNKNELISPEQYAMDSKGDFRATMYAEIYKEYQERLFKNNAMDFDDLLVNTVKLFQTDEQARMYYHNRFRYIHVDEYQDTNTAQFVLLSLLTKPQDDGFDTESNICVVGDDDQSIYKFRGANIYNILNFEKVYKGTTIIRLEQNYRSTSTILNAANEVIANNSMRKEKKLWCDKGEGLPIKYVRYESDHEEAAGITKDIYEGVKYGTASYKDYAILYRTNAQSRIFEENMVLRNIPYKIVGGINFYHRKEIKDVLAYLKTVDNGLDDIAVRRIINIPKRGIGLTTIDRIMNYADIHDISFYDALKDASHIDGINRSLIKINEFVAMIENYRYKLSSEEYPVHELINDILSDTGYLDDLYAEGTDDANSRIENIQELINKAVSFEPEEEGSSLSLFLENVALISDIDMTDTDSNVVLLMTLHGAKGLEFPHVFMCGMEDGIFPSDMAIYAADNSDLEEERRLCYVGITRAMDTLTISCAARRMRNGDIMFNAPSRFIREIPRYLINEQGNVSHHKQETLSFKQDTFSYKPQNKKSNIFFDNPYIKKGFSKPNDMSPSSFDLSVNDRVKHIKFGEGIIKDITDADNDPTVTVEFDNYGTRKMKASFAKLTRIL